MVEKVSEPVVEKVAEPVVEKVAEPVVKKVAEPVIEQVVEPINLFPTNHLLPIIPVISPISVLLPDIPSDTPITNTNIDLIPYVGPPIKKKRRTKSPSTKRGRFIPPML